MTYQIFKEFIPVIYMQLSKNYKKNYKYKYI